MVTVCVSAWVRVGVCVCVSECVRACVRACPTSSSNNVKNRLSFKLWKKYLCVCYIDLYHISYQIYITKILNLLGFHFKKTRKEASSVTQAINRIPILNEKYIRNVYRGFRRRIGSTGLGERLTLACFLICFSSCLLNNCFYRHIVCPSRETWKNVTFSMLSKWEWFFQVFIIQSDINNLAFQLE
jgi:hypothetical protein